MERQYMWGNDSVSLAFEVNADGEYTVSIDKAVAEKYKLGESGATVEIAKKYETPETVKFINGILGTFVRQEMA